MTNDEKFRVYSADYLSDLVVASVEDEMDLVEFIGQIRYLAGKKLEAAIEFEDILWQKHLDKKEKRWK